MSVHRVFCADCGSRTIAFGAYPTECVDCESRDLKRRPVVPGRMGEVGGLVVRNDRGGLDGSWHVRMGTSMSPDYADLDFGGGYTGGRLFTPDAADELADHLRSCANWARSQRSLEVDRAA